MLWFFNPRVFFDAGAVVSPGIADAIRRKKELLAKPLTATPIPTLQTVPSLTDLRDLKRRREEETLLALLH